MVHPPRRMLFIDNLRWSAICMVVVMHAAVTYSGIGRWYVRDAAATGFPMRLALATYQTFQHAVAMGLLFGIAGVFAAAAVGRKGPAAFLRERLFRLGLPLLLWMFVAGPLTQYYVAGVRQPAGFWPFWLRRVGSGAVFGESGPLWFCLVLLALSTVFAAWRAVRPAVPAAPRPPPGAASVLGFAAAMAVLTFAVGLLAPSGTVVLNLDVHDMPQYPLMFAAGVAAGRDGWLTRLPPATGRAWGLAGLAVAAAGWVALVGLGGALQGQLADYGGGWHWQAAGMDAWRSFTCASLTLGLVTLYRDRFNQQGPASRFLTRNAFGVYVVHPPILIAATRALHEWPVDVALKFVLASAIGIACSFLAVGLVARRVPGLRAII